MSPLTRSKVSARGAALLLACLFAATGCDRIAEYLGPGDRPPPNVKGAPMEPMPTTRQQAQDAVYRYYVKTLRELPEGYSLDNSRYGAVGATVVPCSDDGSISNPNDPAQYSDARTIITSAGIDYTTVIARLGEIWKQWGWRVEEDRKGFDKPNRFATAPDGYKLMVEPSPKDAKNRPSTLTGISPCFKGDSTRDEPIPIPTLITRDGTQYGAPAKPPETPSKVFNW